MPYGQLQRNCNFDMTLDTMLFEMWETLREGIEHETDCRCKF